jgi:hypothetical protein
VSRTAEEPLRQDLRCRVKARQTLAAPESPSVRYPRSGVGSASRSRYQDTVFAIPPERHRELEQRLPGESDVGLECRMSGGTGGPKIGSTCRPSQIVQRSK